MATSAIANAEAVGSYFGYWPQFCDGRVVSFSMSEGQIRFAVLYSDTDLGKAAEVRLLFLGTSDIDLNQLASQNVLDELSVEGDGPYVVRMEACCGINGEFRCDVIEVLEVLPHAV